MIDIIQTEHFVTSKTKTQNNKHSSNDRRWNDPLRRHRIMYFKL